MDRLSAVARRKVAVALLFTAASLAAACGTEEPAGAVEIPARVNAVKATKPTASASEWCDVHYEPGKGPRLAVPQVEDARSGGAVGGPSGGGWIWLNLWATWCGPCLREMPLITRWMEALKRDGVAVDLFFLSIDEEPAVLRSFLAERPGITPYNSLHLTRQETLRPWLGSLGLPSDTAIPVNVLAGPGGAVRCVRTGAINDGHYPTIREILGDGR